MDFEKDTYNKHFQLGYEDGVKQSQAKIEENGFRDGVEVILFINKFRMELILVIILDT